MKGQAVGQESHGGMAPVELCRGGAAWMSEQPVLELLGDFGDSNFTVL